MTVFNNGTTICAGDSITLTSLTGFTGHQWHDASGSISGATSSTYVVYASGSYYVIANDANGCSSTSASTAVTVNALSDPSNLSSSNLGFNSVTLSWDAVSGITQYKLTYTDGSTSNSVITTNTSANITGLSSGAAYTWQVQSVCPLNNNIFSTGASGSFTTLSCTAPSNLSSTNVLMDRATMTWDAVTGAAGYGLRFREQGTTTWATINNISGTSRTVYSLSHSTTYEFELRTICSSSSTSSWTSTATFTTLSPCVVATNLSSSGITLTTATLSWDYSGTPDYYLLQYKTNTTGQWTSVTTTSTTYSLTGLNSGTYYNWRVRAVCDSSVNHVSAYTSTNTFNTWTQCADPTSLVANSITATSATLAWASVFGADHYTVIYSGDGGTTWDTVTTTSTSTAITGLTSGVTYSWQVRSSCHSDDSNNSSWVSGSDFTTIIPCTLSITASATDVSCNSGSDGTVSVSVSGAYNNHTIAWSNGSTSSTVSSLSAGSYTVTVTDDNNCVETATVTISEPDALSASNSVSDVSCNGLSDGSIDLTVTGGTSPYTYLWSTGSTDADPTSLSAGSYNVTITDANAVSYTHLTLPTIYSV